MEKPRRPLTILYLLLTMGETSAPYNEYALAWSDEHNVTVCTLFRAAVSPPKEITLFEGDRSVMGFFRVLKAALNYRKYDVIHAHSPHVGFLYLVATVMYGTFTRSTVFTAHNSYPNFRLRNKLLMIPVFAFFRRVVCCGQASYESFPALYRWLARDRLCFVQNGMDIDRVDRIVQDRQRHDPPGTFTVAAVGRLIEIKNPLAVLKAFQQSADRASRLVYIGEGHLHDELLAELQASGLADRVELTGLIPRDRVYEALTQADLFVSASWGEGLPVAVLEAMACRCPVILSDIAPHREIADGAGFIPLVRPDDVAGFALEIERFRQMSPLERAEIGEQGRRLVEERFSLTAMHKGYERVYAQALDEPRAG